MDSTSLQPLNPRLYRALRERFGTVEVANEGCGMQVSYFPSVYGDQKMRTEIAVSGEYYRVCCPWCRDSRHRLWINHQFAQPDAQGWPQLWLAHCYNEDCVNSQERRKELEQLIFGFRNANERRQSFEISPGDQTPLDLGPVRMPGDVLRLNDLPADHYAVTYIRDRRFHNPQYLSDAFGVSFCLRADDQYRPAQNRIIAPVWQHGVLVGWQGRYPDDIDWKVTGIPKYYTRPGMHKSKILYNLDNAKLWPFVVVVEGVTSVWRIGGPAVACFGKSISGGHQSLIYEHWAGKPVLLVLDPDAQDEMEGIVAEMQRAAKVIPIPLLLPAGTDPDNYEHDAIVSMLRGVAAQQGIQLPVW